MIGSLLAFVIEVIVLREPDIRFFFVRNNKVVIIDQVPEPELSHIGKHARIKQLG